MASNQPGCVSESASYSVISRLRWQDVYPITNMKVLSIIIILGVMARWTVTFTEWVTTPVT